MGPLQFCLPIFLGIHRNPKQKDFFNSSKGTSINDVTRFLAIFDLPTYLPTLSYSITSLFGGYLGPPLPTLIWDVINEINERSPVENPLAEAVKTPGGFLGVFPCDIIDGS